MRLTPNTRIVPAVAVTVVGISVESCLRNGIGSEKLSLRLHKRSQWKYSNSASCAGSGARSGGDVGDGGAS